MSIVIDDEVKSWFISMCQEFANIMMIVQDDNALESVQIYFPTKIGQKEGYWKQFATIQYMGVTRQGNFAKYDYIEVRFYVGALEVSNILDIIEAHSAMCEKRMNGGGEKEYYCYKNILDITDFNRYIMPILQNIRERFQEKYGEMYMGLCKQALPKELNKLPR